MTDPNVRSTVESLVDEAMVGLEGLSDEEKAAIRLLLEVELEASPWGQDVVRTVEREPRIDASGSVPKDVAALGIKKPKASGEP